MLANHNPFLSCADIPVDSLATLPVAGIKDSSGSPDRLLDELSRYPGDTYVGSAAFLALACLMGTTGALLALANLAPEACIRAWGGDAVAQHDLAAQHLAVRGGRPGPAQAHVGRGGGDLTGLPDLLKCTPMNALRRALAVPPFAANPADLIGLGEAAEQAGFARLLPLGPSRVQR